MSLFGTVKHNHLKPSQTVSSNTLTARIAFHLGYSIITYGEANRGRLQSRELNSRIISSENMSRDELKNVSVPEEFTKRLLSLTNKEYDADACTRLTTSSLRLSY